MTVYCESYKGDPDRTLSASVPSEGTLFESLRRVLKEHVQSFLASQPLHSTEHMTSAWCSHTTSAWCSLKIVLPKLPPLLLWGTAVFSEFTAQCLPGKVAALGGSPPLRRVLEDYVWLFSARQPLQGTGHTIWNASASQH